MCATHSTAKGNGWDQLGFGIHVCSIYRDKDEQFNSIVPFFSLGQTNGEKCIYIAHENKPEEIAAKIHNTEVFSHKDTYIKEGAFEPDRMISLLTETIADSLKEGYAGVRAAAEMTWILSTDTSLDTLLEYERKLNSFYPSNNLIGVCQYDQKRFSPEFLIEMIRTHPYLVIEGTLYENIYFYTDPEYAEQSSKHFEVDDYETILSIIMNDSPAIVAQSA